MDRYDEFRNCQDQLSYLLKLPIQDRFLNVDSLRYVSNQLESYLIDKCQEYGNYTHNLSSTWQDVQHELKDGDLMVEFFAFQDADSVKQYAALTLDNKDKAPHFYNLFKEIELGDVNEDSVRMNNEESRLTMVLEEGIILEKICIKSEKQLAGKKMKKEVEMRLKEEKPEFKAWKTHKWSFK